MSTQMSECPTCRGKGYEYWASGSCVASVPLNKYQQVCRTCGGRGWKLVEVSDPQPPPPRQAGYFPPPPLFPRATTDDVGPTPQEYAQRRPAEHRSYALGKVIALGG